MEIDDLRKEFSGDIILPADDAYEAERKTYLHDKNHPAVIVRPKSAADVAKAIGFAKSKKLQLSVRSGGHSGPGYGTNDDGMVIDLSSLHDVAVLDKAKRLVRLGAGAKWGDVAVTLAKEGLGISSGDTRSVGVGGLTLGGGIGWMVRNYGLALDSLVAAEIVTADGDVLHASEFENEDVFWAIRGGGGNIGVVTSFDFIAHPVDEVFAGPIQFSLDSLPALLKGWRDAMRAAPEELNTTLLVMPSMGGAPPMAIVLACYAGDDEAVAMQAIQPILDIPGCAGHQVARKAYPDVLEDAHTPGGFVPIVKNGLIKELSDEFLEVLAQIYGKQTGPLLMMRSLGGAMNRVPADATAFAHRDSEVLLITAVFQPLDLPAEKKAEVMAFWNRILPFATGAYINFLNEWNDEDLHLAYPEQTLERLREIKKRYDPENIFRLNYNIKPAD